MENTLSEGRNIIGMHKYVLTFINQYLLDLWTLLMIGPYLIVSLHGIHPSQEHAALISYSIARNLLDTW